MIIEGVNPSRVLLEALPLNFDGSVKTDIVTAQVRVYHIVAGDEVDILSFVDMIRKVGENSYKYVWVPSSLSEGVYTVEYTLTDVNEIVGKFVEPLIVGYLQPLVNSIKTNTDRIPVDPASESGALAKESTLFSKAEQATVNAIKVETDKISSVKIRTDLIPSDPAREVTVNTRASQSSVDAVKTETEKISSIKIKTDLLPHDPASESGVLAKEATLNTRASQISVDALAAAVNLIQQIETGRWKIVANQMIFYKDDNATEIVRFDLFNAKGQPSMVEVVERRKAV